MKDLSMCSKGIRESICRTFCWQKRESTIKKKNIDQYMKRFKIVRLEAR